MIYSMTSDLETRQIRWIGRNVLTDRQYFYNDTPVLLETEWVAGIHADRYADDVKLPAW